MQVLPSTECKLKSMLQLHGRQKKDTHTNGQTDIFIAYSLLPTACVWRELNNDCYGIGQTGDMKDGQKDGNHRLLQPPIVDSHGIWTRPIVWTRYKHDVYGALNRKRVRHGNDSAILANASEQVLLKVSSCMYVARGAYYIKERDFLEMTSHAVAWRIPLVDLTKKARRIGDFLYPTRI